MAIIQGNAKQGSTRGFYPKAINGSLRFNDDDSPYLKWNPASAGNQKTWTFSAWVKLGNIATNKTLFAARTDVSATYTVVYLNSAGDLRIESNTETAYPLYKTNAIFRDPSAWYHFVVSVDMTQATSNNRIKVYVNGELQTTASYNVPAQNTNLNVNSTADHYIGRQAGASYIDGYLANVHFIDGQALTASDFGETKNGVWVAKDYAGTFGTNGFHLEFNAQLPSFTADYLVVGGGGGGGRGGGGGGAGGFREFTGKTLYKGYAYPLTVGLGGAGSSDYYATASNGGDSIFVITAAGGGGGGSHLSVAASGGSGGGGGSSGAVNAGGSGNTPSTSPSQGNNGGTSSSSASAYGAGGGGGAGSVGATGTSTSGGNGGSGSVSTIDGNTYAGGGGGTSQSGSGFGTGGSGIGGDAGNTGNGGDAVASTGSGGGGTGFNAGGNQGGSGSDGIILIKIPDTVTATFSGGVTQSSSTAGGYVTYTVTATSGSETVEFS